MKHTHYLILGISLLSSLLLPVVPVQAKDSLISESNLEILETTANNDLSSTLTDNLLDGEYAIELTITGGSGKASVQSPSLLTVVDGTAYASITWSSSNYDYMIINGETYWNDSPDGANSHFTVPILDLTQEIPILADTSAMGTPHEIPYTLLFYPDSIKSKSTLPQEGAKRVLLMAFGIIVGGGILNHFANERRKQDYSGKRR